MKRLTTFLPLFMGALLLFSSCADVNEEIIIRNNGSGTYTTEYDLSNLLGMIKMMDQFGDDDTGGIMDEIPNIGNSIDTSFLLGDIAPDTVRKAMENPEILDRTTLSLTMDMEKQEMKMGLTMIFRSFDEVGAMYAELDALSSSMNEDVPSMKVFTESLFSQDMVSRYVLDRGTFIRKPIDMSNGAIPENLLGGEGGEFLQMMQMMGGQGSYVTTLHFPGKIKSIDYSGEYEQIDKKTIRIESSFGDLFEQKELPGYEIDFRCCIFCGIKKNRS